MSHNPPQPYESNLLDFIQATMTKAVCSKASCGLYHGSIPGFDQLQTTAKTEEECKTRLQLGLEEWVLFCISTNRKPQLEPLNSSIVKMEHKFLLVKELQRDITILKRAIKPHHSRGVEFARSFGSFAVVNWSFLAFIIGLLIGFWVYFYYGVNTYLEDIHKVYTNKQTAKKYSELGDRLVERGEFTPAGGAYNTALKLDPNNVDAISMIYILSILEGPYIPEILDAKLIATRKTIERDQYLRKYLYVLSYFEGERKKEQQYFGHAILRFQNSVNENPKFLYGYIALAESQLKNTESFDNIIATLENALKVEPNSAIALNNLGALYIVKQDFNKAIHYLEQALALAPYLETYVQLGDAYRYSKRVSDGRDKHQAALAKLGDPQYQERYVGSSTYNFMPDPSDSKVARNRLSVSEIDGHKAIVNYALSFDHALLGEYPEADKAFAAAFNLLPDKEKDRFFINKIAYIENTFQLDDSQKNWFRLQKNQLTRRTEVKI